MASNREERLQMRQRGAGTRKIKEVDFGFSLFGQTAGESSQAASQPGDDTELDQAPAPTIPSLIPPPSGIADTESLQPRPASSPTPANPSFQEPVNQRTPGSARNKLPARPSIFDIPQDEEAEPTRSSKRRRVESPKETSPLAGAQTEIQSDASRNGAVEEPAVPPIHEGVTIPIRTSPVVSQAGTLLHTSLGKASSLPTNETNELPLEAPRQVPDRLEPGSAPTTVSEPPQLNGTISPASDTSKGKGRGRKRGRPSPSRSDASNTILDEAVVPQPPESTELPREQEPPTGPEISQPQDKRLRSRIPASVQPPDKSPSADEPSIPDASSEAVPSDTAAGKSRRGRKRKSVEAAVDNAADQQSSNESAMAAVGAEAELNETTTTREPTASPRDRPNGVDTGKKHAGRPKKLPSASPVPVDGSEPNTTAQNTERDSVLDRQPEAEAVPSKRKQRRNREPTPRQDEQPAAESVESSRRAKSRKPRKDREPTPPQEEPEPEIEAEAPRVGRKKKQREERQPSPRPTEQAEAETGPPRAGRKKKQRAEREATPQDEQPEPAANAQVSRTGRKRKQREESEPASGQAEQSQPEPETKVSRSSKKRKQLEQQGPTPEQEDQPEPEPESREQSKGTKRRRDRRPTTPPDEQAAQTETTGAQLQAPKRNPRQPRGETVPVTVHRLANASSLHGVLVDESASDNDADSPDESSKQATKQLTRGGVNAADVLAQICRETLEKTLTTLSNGIANEANTAKRAEWTLRKKAVEAFGSELEGRLFDLSEMLDSNFMLGTKVKKAKRNMMDLRSRLDQVRKEREAIALRMDAVRRDHARGEKAGLTRSTINHTLHNLDLALERGANRSTTENESLTAGLEFRLRLMAQSVSSTVDGGHGGLLNQIKSFNAQLEATARELER
ncbi:hypothetical protein BJX70DRAFT_203188 [Aspergillus crustosus]